MKLPKFKLPFYVPLLTGLFLVTIGGLVFTTALGLIPTGSQDFRSPRWMVGAVGAGLLMGGIVIWLPKRAPKWLFTGLGIGVWIMLLAVVNFSASSTGQAPLPGGIPVGPFIQPAPDPASGKLMVGSLAVIADAYSVWWVVKRVLPRHKGEKDTKDIKKGKNLS